MRYDEEAKIQLRFRKMGRMRKHGGVRMTYQGGNEMRSDGVG
jgi:hypothetical protein